MATILIDGFKQRNRFISTMNKTVQQYIAGINYFTTYSSFPCATQQTTNLNRNQSNNSNTPAIRPLL